MNAEQTTIRADKRLKRTSMTYFLGRFSWSQRLILVGFELDALGYVAFVLSTIVILDDVARESREASRSMLTLSASAGAVSFSISSLLLVVASIARHLDCLNAVRLLL